MLNLCGLENSLFCNICWRFCSEKKVSQKSTPDIIPTDLNACCCFFVCDDCKEGTPCLFLHWRFFTVLLKDKNPSLNYVMALMCTSVNIGTWLRRSRTKSQPHLFYIHKKKKNVTSANVWFYDYLFLVSSVHYPGFKVWVCFYVSSPNNKTEAAANCIFMTLKSCSFFFWLHMTGRSVLLKI